MKKTINIFLLLVSIFLLVYAFFPSPEFPVPPDGALQSDEPADTEDPLRRAYFVNQNRAQIIEHYRREFNKSFLFYSPQLNYPPEEAQTIIRDQTRSTYLEETVHPFRESLFVNGFEPKTEKDTINIAGRTWNQKIIVRYIPSNIYVRIVITLSTLALGLALVREYRYVKEG